MQEMELTYVGTCSCCNHVMHKWVLQLSMAIYIPTLFNSLAIMALVLQLCNPVIICHIPQS